MSNPSAEDGRTVFVIPHTHWDREWYATFQQFRVRLVHMLDALLDLLEHDPSYTHFNLDGQTVLLQDYLEIRPEKRESLQKYIRAGRLGVGPWYVLPDEFLVSGEALIRNLLLGHRFASEFGHVQKVGYIPDTFGHISQLPQMLRGFDIPYAMHFRGLDEGELKSELWWQSPDGSRVLLRHLPTDMGYGNASSLAAAQPEAVSDLLAVAREEERRAASSILLAMNGMDHMQAREDLPAILSAANQAGAGAYHFRQGSLEEYFSSLEAALAGQALQTVYGELRDVNRTPGRDNRLLPHVLSAHIYIKQQNERVQTLLERWAEPWSAVAWLEGEQYPAAFLWKAWELLLQNQAHDSIGGCSIDAVQSEMETRFAGASEIAGEILKESFELISRKVDLSDLREDEAALVVFNNLPWERTETVTVDIDLWDAFLDQVAMNHWNPVEPESDLPAAASASERYQRRIRKQWWDDRPSLPDPRFRGLHIRPLGDEESLPVQIESIGRSHSLRPLVSGPASERSGARVRASFVAKLPAFGYQVFAVTPTERPNRPVTILQPANVLENEYLQVQIAPNGTLTIKDKTTGEIYRDLAYFEDGGDCGDCYNYSPPLEERLENTLGAAPGISCLSRGPFIQRYQIDYDWLLPEGLDPSHLKRSDLRTLCPLSVVVSLVEGSRALDLQVAFDNRACDHRLRILFPSDIETDHSLSAAQFDVVRHPIKINPVPEAAWVEDAPATFPQQDWVDLSDGKRGLCLVNQGLPEYEVLDTSRREAAVTLLRSVGYLGAAANMQSAFAGAGPNIATPHAQCRRSLGYSLSILPHTGTWHLQETWREAARINNPVRAFTTGMVKNQPLVAHPQNPARRPFLSVEGKNVILSAVKKAEAGEALIMRLYNPTDAPTAASIWLASPHSKVQIAGLDEKEILPAGSGEALVEDPAGIVQVTLPPGKIITLRIEKG